MTPEQRFQKVLTETLDQGESFDVFWAAFCQQSVVDDGHTPDHSALIRTAWSAASSVLPESTLLCGVYNGYQIVARGGS